MAELKDNQPITKTQLMSILVGIVISGLTFWMHTETRFAVLETQQTNGNADRSRIENKIDKLTLTMDEVRDRVSVLNGISKINTK